MMKKLVVGNWKLYPTLADSLVLAGHLKQSLETIQGVDVVIAPPLPWLVPIIQSWQHRLGHLHLAAQNLWPEDQGAYTGEISAYMLKDLVSYAIIGHSERRQYNHEDNDVISQKVQSALKWGITPILCVGEAKKSLNDDGEINKKVWEDIEEELLEGLSGVSKEKLAEVVIAYEPIWAIGYDKQAKAEYVVAIIRKLRSVIAEKYSRPIAESMRFLYGGSVSNVNVASYLQFPEINGFLIGTMSVRAKEFVEVCRLAAQRG